MTTLAAPQPTAGAVSTSWDGQIVPALRKRLESESAYLNDRLSVITSESGPSQHPITFPSSQPSSSGAIQRTPSHPPSSTSPPRTRMKSTPLSAPRPKSSIQPNSPSTYLNASSSRSKQGSTSLEQTPSYIPSRIPTRPRSKSQLAQRPLAPLRGHSNTSTSPSSPSSAGMMKSRSNSSDRSVSDGRGSPDFGGGGVKEGLIKNELPPFKMFSDEAMRIATSGYDLDEGGRIGYTQDEEDDQLSKRKRAITMKNVESPSKKTSQNTTSASRSANTNPSVMGTTPLRDGSGGVARTTTGIGLGQPGNPSSTSINPRSSSSRSPNPKSSAFSPNLTSSTQTRSASLNMLASSPTTSRLAHLIPPEQTYKPPKGVNWDEVVIPTIAKKLAAGQGTNEGQIEDGDLAIEWDKDGTPVKWVKWNASPRLDSSTNSNSSALTTDAFVGYQPQPSPTKASNPKPLPLAPSADEPHLPVSVRQQPSYQSIRSSRQIPIPTPPIESYPPQITSQYIQDDPPLSPAPFSSLIPRPADWDPPAPEPAPISRKPSLLKKHSGQPTIASRQASTMSIGTRYQQQGGGDASVGGVGQQRMGMGMGNTEYFSNPRPVPVPGMPRQAVGVGNGKQDRPGHGDVKKGCGCIVM